MNNNNKKKKLHDIFDRLTNVEDLPNTPVRPDWEVKSFEELEYLSAWVLDRLNDIEKRLDALERGGDNE